MSAPLGRRPFALGLAAAGLAAGLPRAGQAAETAGFPCPSRPGDIVGLLLEGGGAPAGSIATFGHPFRPGDLPAGRILQARLADGRPLPVQVDVRNTHPDGSARTAVIALAAPALANGQRAGVLLSAASGTPAAPLEAGAWAQRQAAVQVTGAGGRAWRLELMPLLPAALARGRAWQSGPLAVQGRIEAPVPHEAAGGVSSLRLVADLAVQSDGVVRLDAWLRNDVSMRDGGGTARYTAAFLLDGQEAGRFEIGRQWQYTGWGRLALARPGAAGNAPRVLHDASYLADTGAVARYDLRTGVDEALLAKLGAATAEPGWATPLGGRGISQDMYQTGGRSDIGPATQPQAVWLMTGDRRAAAYAIGQAEAAGSVPWHLWDPAGGAATGGGRNAPGPGGWLDALRWPRLWTDGRGGPPPGGLAQPMSDQTEWKPDVAHQPDLSYVPYLLTGRRAFLDELQAQAAWSVLAQWPAMREIPGGPVVNVVRGNQVRGAAWSLRQLDNAAWTAPEGDPNAAYFRIAADANWGWLRASIPGWSAEQGELQGVIPGAYGAKGTLPPWQQDYFASTAAAAARRGNADALVVLRWMGNFLAGRFLAAGKGFDPHDGAAYLMAAQDTDQAQPLRRWSEAGQAMRAKNLSNNQGWDRTQGDYAQLALQSLAALVDLTGTAEARDAYTWLAAANAPFTRQQDFRRDPTFNIVPKLLAARRCGI